MQNILIGDVTAGIVPVVPGIVLPIEMKTRILNP
jgi:hypothetical protein